MIDVGKVLNSQYEIELSSSPGNPLNTERSSGGGIGDGIEREESDGAQ
jgi:hypothetical protein